MRTSQSHPLYIAAVQSAPGYGRVGITFCPGKQQASAMTGAWQRDLTIDIAAIGEFGAAAVVTLIEEHEFAALQVQGLGEAVISHHMEWLHLPISDMGTPRPEFEKQWRTVGPGLRKAARRVRCGGPLHGRPGPRRHDRGAAAG